jgi:hypothetical protein
MSYPTEPEHQGWWPATLPDIVWAPVTVGVMLLVIGMTALVAGLPWLFSSLGPTAFLLADAPDERPSRAYNLVVGHLLGLGIGFMCVWALGANHAPALPSSGHVTAMRVWTAVLALALTAGALILCRARHPPAASTAVIVALGGFHFSVHDAVAVVAGILLTAVIGECLRYLRLGQLPLPEDLGPC